MEARLSDLVTDDGDGEGTPALGVSGSLGGGGGGGLTSGAAGGAASAPANASLLASPPSAVGMGPSERLYVRAGQPIESCELEPFATLFVRGQAPMGESVPSAGITFRWSRSAASVLICAFSRCRANRAALGADTSPAARAAATAAAAAATAAAAGLPSSRAGTAAGARAGASSALGLTATRGAASGAGVAASSSSSALGGPFTLQCLDCARGAGGSTPLPFNVFCSARCLRRGWKEHAQ
jgi:hypothetical protein